MATLRSSRRSAARRRYTVDPLEGIEGLQSEDEFESPSTRRRRRQDDSDDDDDEEFDGAAESQVDDDDDYMSDVNQNANRGPQSDPGSDAGETDLDDDLSIAEDLDASISPSKRKDASLRRIRKQPVKVSDDDEVFFRGLPDRISYAAASKLLHNFGPSSQTHEQLREASSKWGHDLCLPSRQTLKSTRGVHSHHRKDNDQDWYEAKGGREAFFHRQAIRSMTIDDVRDYLLDGFTEEQTFVMGPINQQMLFNLPVGQAMGLATAFPRNDLPHRQPPRYKSGYMLNLGARVQCLEWASSQSGADQYLAAASTPDRIAHGEPRRGSAFTPQPNYRANVQIWHFRATPDHYINTAVPPRRSLTICTSIGDIKALKWCPIRTTDDDTLGLLGCIGTDGAIRVYHVPMPSSDSAHMLIESTAFESKPPNTVCTCLTWLSSRRIAAGCANGCIAVWDLPQSLQSSTPNPRPALYFSVAMTYIVSIDNCSPSYPDFVLATNMAGYITMTDLRDPAPGSHTGTAATPARQVGKPLVVWHNWSRSCFSVEDNYTARAFPLRRLFASIKVGRFAAHCLVMAASPVHPCVLVGLANGHAVAFNPLRRITGGSRDRDPLWAQTWFAHEWRRPTKQEVEQGTAAVDTMSAGGEEDATAGAEAESAAIGVGMNGLSRIAEGFRMKQMQVAPEPGKGGHLVKDGTLYTTIYEEKSAVTVVAWNPNVHVGGWAAAGMGNGLVRVEDIAA